MVGFMVIREAVLWSLLGGAAGETVLVLNLVGSTRDRRAWHWPWGRSELSTLLAGLIARLLLTAAISVPLAVTGRISDSSIFFALGIVAPFLIARMASVASSLMGEQKRVQEGKQRVRVAEQGLEQALRGPDVRDAAHVSRVATEIPAQGGEISSSEPSTSEGEVSDAVDMHPRLALPELWSVTHSRLDLYHEIALGQARRSFRNAQAASGIGFTFLAAFVVVAINASTTAGAVVAGGLGTVSAALAGYVSKTFVKSQEASASHLRSYFDQPLEFSRYLAVERIIADSGLNQEQRVQVLTALVQSMVATSPASPSEVNGLLT